MPATTKGKEYALQQLEKRRSKNAKKEKVDNSSLYAGSPMYFYCTSCEAEIVVPESYTSRKKICDECQALKDCGWLE